MTTGPDGNPNNTLPLRDLVGNRFWEKNVVHDYSSVTYDITLAMTTTANAKRWLGYEASGEKDAEEINSLDNKEVFRDEIIILAQTASTITQITRLDIEGYASPNQRSNLTYSTKMKADIVQPQGQSLIRNIYKAAGMLGIENHYSHPYFLQIYLKGRTKDGSEIVQEIPGTRRLYAVFINNITYRVELGGTTYGVEMIRTGNMALADDHQLLGDMEFNGLINFGDFIASFEDNLKKQERNYLGQSKLILDQYKIKVQGAPIEGGAEAKYEVKDTDKINFETAKIINDNDVDNFVAETTATGRADQQSGMGTVRAEIDKNTSITEVLEKFVSRNSWIKNQAKTVRGNLSEAFKNKKFKADNLDKMLFTISTHTELLQYDPLRRDYAKKFTFIINLMNFTTVLAAVRDEFNKDRDYTKKRINHMISKRRLLKRYDYFNTGINLDVITFDLQYNFQYVFGLDTVVGLYNKYGKEFYSKFQEKNSSQAKIDKAGAVSSQSNWNAMTKDGINQQEELAIANHRYQVLRKAREAYTQGGVEPDANTLNAYNQLVEDYNNNLNEWERMNSAGDGGETMYDFDKAQNLKENEIALRPTNQNDYSGIGSKNRIGEQTFAEKIDDKTFMEKDQGIIVPVQFYERYFKPESEGVIGVGANSDFHTIMKNAKVGSNEMVNATIDIIGDPYWLDYTPSNSKFNDPKVANYRTEKVVLFSSLGPGEVDPDTGMIPPGNARADEFLTALYRVWKVDHTFDNGQFTQRLSVIRDTITDLSLMQEAVTVTESSNDKVDSKKQDIVDTAKNLDGVSTADVVGNDNKKNAVDPKLLSAVENKKALTKNLNKGKLMIDGKEVSKEKFNEHYVDREKGAKFDNTYNYDGSRLSEDKTRIIGGF